MTSQIEIKTPKLLLKSITPDIINWLFGHKTREEITAFFGVDNGGYEHLRSMQEGGMETHRLSLFYFLLCDKATGQVIGECGFHTWNRTHHRAELFYSLRNDAHKRKGLMTEALQAVLDFGFKELGLHRIAALVASDNIASVKLLDRYGFTKEGTMREDYVVNGVNESSDCYSLLQWEWAQSSSR